MKAAAVERAAVEWAFAALVLAVGIANLLLVHPVPAVGYGMASLVYVPPVNRWLGDRFGVSIHPLAKMGLAIVIAMFTLGVSDLGDMID